MRKLVLLGLIQAVLLLAGCGGGGGSGSVATSTSNNGTGGGGGGQAANVVSMIVDGGPNGNDVDTPFITITVCAPGSTTNCQQIDHVEVDTGSYGLRIMSSVLSSSLAAALPQETSADGNSVVECTEFADGFSWGPVKTANVQIAGESASNVPVQIIGDPAYMMTSTAGGTTTKEIPSTCSSNGPEEDSVATFGANGIIGIGVHAADCPSCDQPYASATNPNPGFYWECPASWSPSTPCSQIVIAQSAQVTNPVTLFQTDWNGVVIALPSAAEGASKETGTLTFGIGTEGNNSVAAQNVLTTDYYGDVTTTYTALDGSQLILPYSYFDTGSNAYYFADQSIPSVSGCSGYPGYDSSSPDSWYCPRSELNLHAINTGQNGVQAPVQFSIGNAYTLFNSTRAGTIFNDLGASSGPQQSDCTSQTQDLNCSFDFGFPFFLGRTVYIAFSGANTSWGGGPFIAY